MKIAHFISGLVILLLLTTCKHTQYDVRGCGEFTTYEDVKDFGMFPVGTYWVYENQLTLERDTFTVYAFELGYIDGEEAGFLTSMVRTSENAEWHYFHTEAQNIFPHDDPCLLRRIRMSRIDFDSQGMVNSIQESLLAFPTYQNDNFISYCGTESYEVDVTQLKAIDLLEYSQVLSFTVVGTGFSLNSCVGDTYRYQFGQGIGLISWENLDSLDGKWQLIEFERAE